MSARVAFHDLSEFPLLEQLSFDWELIRDEVRQLDAPELDIDRVGKSHLDVLGELVRLGKGAGWLRGWTHDNEPNDQWLSYGMIVYDRTAFGIPRLLPQTMKRLCAIKGIKVGALNKMKPHTLLSTHTHPELPTEGLLQFHLCLEAAEPSLSYLNVDGEFVQQVPGQAYVFDGSLPHFALNATSADRIILYIEFHEETLRRSVSSA